MAATLPTLHESYPFISPQKYAGSLKDKVTIVTGTSGGIGAHIAKAFAAAGAKVACIARREPELNAVVDEIKSNGGEAYALVADVSAKGAARQIVTEVEAKYGPIDILVNNVGIARISPLDAEDEDLSLWWRIYDTNVRAPITLIRAVLPSMLQRKSGVIMSVSSNTATLDLPCMSAYASSKAALSKVHESLSVELDGTGVRIFALDPGRVASGLGQAENAINKDAMQHPGMQKFMASVMAPFQRQDGDLSADTLVALAADERCKVLVGRHVMCIHDLEEVVKEAEKEGKGRIGKERLYLVNIGGLGKPE